MLGKILQFFVSKLAFHGNTAALALPWQSRSVSMSDKKKTLAWLILL